MAATETSSRKTVVVVGAGLAGGMTALFLARRKDAKGAPLYNVQVVEKRGDFRARELAQESTEAYGAATDTIKRSINLALSKRGEEALKGVGLLDEVKPTLVPMHGRVIHSTDGEMSFQPYGRPGQHISSVARDGLTRLLLDRLDDLENVTLLFNRKIRSARADGSAVFAESDDDGREVRGRPETSLKADLLIGADGAFSRVREAMLRGTRVDFSRTFIEHSYKELHMPPAPGAADAIRKGDDEAGFLLPHPHGLHIWPRHEFMLIALPNPDRTFTCTLFAPDDTFAALDAHVRAGRRGEVVKFFKTNFPDACELIGEDSVCAQYEENPKGSLVTVRVKPWIHGRLLLVGDAAHAVVPFFGQGMNAAFEDALELDISLNTHGDDLDKAAADFAKRRQPAGDGLADLSLENYAEMRSHTASPLWVMGKRIEGLLHAIAPDWWVPRYSMVSFARVPYHEARDIAHRQEEAVTAMGQVAAVAGIAAGLAGAWALYRDSQSDWSGLKSVASAVGLPL